MAATQTGSTAPNDSLSYQDFEPELEALNRSMAQQSLVGWRGSVIRSVSCRRGTWIR